MIKKLYLTTIILLILIANVYSFEYQSFGARYGAVFSNMRGGVWEDSGQILGHTGGVYARWLMGESMVLQTELLYTQKGGTRNETADVPAGYLPGVIVHEFKLDYIDIPILAKYILRVEDNVNTHFMLGPCFSFNVRGVQDITNNWDDSIEQRNKRINNLADMDFNFVLAVGLDLYFFNLDIRYTTGFASIYADNSSNIRNRAASFSAGFFF